MGEYTDLFVCPADPEETRARAAACIASFEEAAGMAALFGLRLVCHSSEHYQLIRDEPKAIWNLYPRSGQRKPRIYSDPKHRGGFLKLDGDDWTLLDVVKAAVGLTQEQAKKEATR